MHFYFFKSNLMSSQVINHLQKLCFFLNFFPRKAWELCSQCFWNICIMFYVKTYPSYFFHFRYLETWWLLWKSWSTYKDIVFTLNIAVWWLIIKPFCLQSAYLLCKHFCFLTYLQRLITWKVCVVILLVLTCFLLFIIFTRMAAVLPRFISVYVTAPQYLCQLFSRPTP